VELCDTFAAWAQHAQGAAEGLCGFQRAGGDVVGALQQPLPMLLLTVPQYCPHQNLITGAWGCGAFKGDRFVTFEV